MRPNGLLGAALLLVAAAGATPVGATPVNDACDAATSLPALPFAEVRSSS